MTAFALAIIGLAALRAQFDALIAVPLAADRIWAMAAYFTILTNALLVVHLLAITKGWQMSASRAAGLLLAISAVGIIYHALLGNQFPTDGLGWWADLGLHTVMPLGYTLWWLGFAPKALPWRDVPHWLIWPVIYTGYALIRGHLTGQWPYPFLNADSLGWAHVARNLGVLLGALGLLGLGIAALARILHSAKPG
ncbi:Pr6Pr family membrane protein [Cypionkella sp.]|uniref:Pr6Pr family membrane protein n=1 Tax=Cypionkella sp. TaxID=2811411 RepID=UPI002AB8FDC8|nr:Pr6Pr family membrane protein [Cypionkella sp.]MDZ4391830.1 Pr6Pr family membrane protein [Cypionkella sp.]